MERIAQLITDLTEYDTILDSVRNRKTPVEVTGLSPIHKANLAAALAGQLHRQAVVICPDELACDRMARDLEAFSDRAVAILPTREFIFHNIESSSREYEHKRISVLCDLAAGKKTVVTTIPALLMASMPPEQLKQATFTIDFNGEYDTDALVKQLVLAGYRRCMQVEGEGQFSLRGGILDIFVPGEGNPVRIEFFGTEVDTMSYFDIGSQRRTRSLEKLVCLPNMEVLPTLAPDGVDGLIARIEKIIASRSKKHPDLDRNLRRDVERLRNDGIFPAADKYLPYIYPELSCAADYIPEDAMVFVDDFRGVREAARIFDLRMQEDIEALLERGQLYGKQAVYHKTLPEAMETLSQHSMVYLETFLSSVPECPPKAMADIMAKQLPPYSGNVAAAASDIRAYQDMAYRVIVLCSGEMRRTTMKEMLEEQGVSARVTDRLPAPGRVSILDGSLSAGMEYPALKTAVLTEGQMLAARKKSKEKKKKSNRDHVRSYADLTPGDLVVHEHHGIGRFVGMERMRVEGTYQDFIKIAFAGTDFLYVPATNLDLISKYIGAGSDAAETGRVKLNKLGGTEWQKTRYKAKTAVKELASQLIALYAERERKKGFAFPKDDSWQHEFEAAFEYEETEDQLRCVEEIKKDMESDRPMDRLLCGDVGFGKTEVALRAVMKCVLGGKQAAILVPTTVLARQHYLTCLSRFSGWPVKIEMLSRFKTAKEQKIILEKVKQGQIDLLIGTHKLFNKSMKFKDLGLLVVDEEQRFGVSHKEKLKEMSRQVDVLTLSATPIPRTLNMALSGIRDMSVLEEPPQDRHPVQTYVMEYDTGVVAEAMRREFYRGGQTYYLHNQVESIDTCAAKIKKMLPDAEVAVAHGKMSQRELSRIMTRMSDGDIDILVCTTIIETGIDIPNVNTLIIENADKMGLSQLHQLRGRVGRSARHAFAYFTFQRGKTLSDISQKRLSAVREFAEFGSGFKIAMRDLEIRGAGNVLGAEQSGHLMNVGYDLYLKLLEEAVLEEKGEKPRSSTDCTIELLVNANLPEKYVEDSGQRVDLYRRIAAIHTETDRTDLLDELIDRFGEPPASAVALCDIALLRSNAAAQGVTEIKQQDGRILMTWSKEDTDLRRMAALCGSKQFKGRLLLNAGEQPYLSLRMKPKERPMQLARELVQIYAQTGEKA
ncbi:transcription-repair coupling factor [Butyricicoccus sp.]|uniref:transcription-repair coupling factor n=1 Tax=Butyricicoccus sp. TaxID=2049021 RepID=UPI003F1504ED